MRRLALTAAALILAAPLPATALDPAKALSECTVDAWRVRDGLPGAWVRGMTQSRDGYLWIATYGGVARYGGDRLLPLPAEPPLQQLSDALAALAAPDGTVFLVPAEGAPVCWRDGAPGSCLRAGQALIGDLHNDAAALDHEGALWLAGLGGIRRIGADGSAALVYPRAKLPPGEFTALHRDRRGVLWLATRTSLLVERGGELRETATPAALGAVGAIFPARSTDALWVAGAGGLLRIGSDAQLFESGASARRPTTGLEDSDGNVWIATRGGLLRFFDRRFTLYGKADGLPDDDLSALFEDREGSLWLGTRGAGLVQITDRTLDSQSGPPSLRDSWISALCEDDARALFFATSAGLVRWKDGVEQTIGRAEGLPSANVRTVHPAPGGGVWIGTDGGLARWRDGRVDRPVPVDDPVSSMHVDGTGVTWLGTENGLWRVGPSLDLQRIPAPELRGLEVRGLQHDDEGVLWASAGGRLARVDGGELRSARLQIDGQPVGRVRALYRDDGGVLWLGTASGLVRRARGRWQSLPGAAREIFQMVSDRRGFLWAGTGRGILRIDPRALLDAAAPPGAGLVLYDTSGRRRDVAATRTRQPAAIRAHDDSLWFATARGVVRVDPARLRLRRTLPVVRIESTVLDGRPVAPGGQAAVFPPGAGNLEVHFSAITLVEPDKARHRYRLEGFDREWIDAGNRRVAYYTNLPPGRYRFRVQGSNADGVWNEAGDSLALRLRPHLHQTVWFYATCALGLAGLGLGAHRLRVRGVRERFLAALAERGRIARELHDSLLQGMAAAAMRLRGLRKKVPTSEPELTAELRAVEEQLAASIVETRQVVLDLREPTGTAPELGAALSRLVRQLTAGAPLAAEVVVQGRSRPVAPAVQRELHRIAQEAVKNAVLHAAASKIEVRLRYDDDYLALMVADDGRGFDTAGVPAQGHVGLLGLRERAARLGTLELHSEPGHGTRLRLQVRAPYAAAEAPT